MPVRCWPTALLYLCLAFTARLVWASGPAGIKLDGTLGPSAAALAGPTYNITQNLGKLSGGNLFFSFQYFNVATGETALFTTTSTGINNVISRVTGGYASTIDGTISLQAASGAPNFFLINPSGVTFTSNAVIDVPAAFYVSTANYLKFSDGNFYVDPTKMSTLSAAAPEAFGFLDTTRAAVNVQRANLSAGVNGAGDFQITAGDVTVDGAGQLIGVQNTSGNIRVVAVGSAAGEVPLSGAFDATDGTVTIRNGGLLLTQGQGSTDGGAIEVYAGSLLIDGLSLAINNTTYQQTGIGTLTDTQGAGTDSAGSITVRIDHGASIVNGGVINSISPNSGNTGNLFFSAGSLTEDGRNFVGGDTGMGVSTGGRAQAGNVAVNVTGGLTMKGYSLISDETFGTGSSGNITVNAGQVSLLDFGEIISNTFADGNAGNIELHAASLTIDGGPNLYVAGIDAAAETFGTGSGGNIVAIITGSTIIRNDGELATSTFGSGNAGNISLRTGSLSIIGPSGSTSAAGIGVAPSAYDPLWIDPEQAWREALIGSTYAGVAAANTQEIEPRVLFACR